MFFLVIFATLAAAVVTAFNEGDCDRMMEAALATRDSIRSETSDRWRDVKLWTVKLINLDLDDDANLKETLCKMAESGIKTVEDLHSSLSQHLGHYGVVESTAKTALVYSSFVYSLSQRLKWLEYDVKQIKTKLQFFGQTGFPDFPLGFTSDELVKMLNNYDEKVIGNMFWQITANEESKSWKPKLANALAEAQNLNYFLELLTGHPSNYGEDYQRYKKPSEEDLHTQEENMETTNIFIQELKSIGLWDLPRSDRKLSCDSVIADTLGIITLLQQVFPNQYSMVSQYLGLSYIVNHQSRLTKWLCQVIESKSQTEMAKLFPNGVDVLNKFWPISHSAMTMLAEPGLPLFFVNKAIVLLKALDEIDFPNFPLSITKDKANEVAEKLSDEWWGAEGQESVARALQNAHSLTDFDRNYDIPRHVLFRNIHDKLQGHVDQIEDFFFMAFRVLTAIEAGGLLMLPK